MSRYIDADALDAKIDLLYRVPPIMDMVFAHYNHGVGDAHAIIHNMPSADVVERKRGKWIQDKNVVMGEGYVWYCSECSWARFYGFNEPMQNYCPWCGADMREVEE